MTKNFKKFTVDFEAKAIKCSKKAYERACKGMKPEYKELCDLVEKHPTFEVKVKTAEETATKKMYRKLTIPKMREYIDTKPNKDELHAEMDIVIEIATAKNAKYPLTKKWFLAKFPEYKENEAVAVAEEQQQAKRDELEAELSILNDEYDEASGF